MASLLENWKLSNMKAKKMKNWNYTEIVYLIIFDEP